MNDQEKSVKLARLCGWKQPKRFVPNWRDSGTTVAYYDGYMNYPNLYDPANMQLAWRVLNFIDGTELSGRFNVWFYNQLWVKISPADAQRLWLDKILQLADEAGMV